jgi:hypothetical protein
MKTRKDKTSSAKKFGQNSTPVKKTRSNVLNQQLISRARCGNGIVASTNKTADGSQVIGFGPGALRLSIDPRDQWTIASTPLDKRDRFQKDFEIIEKLGEGEFGIAYKVRVVTSQDDVPGALRAVKQQK